MIGLAWNCRDLGRAATVRALKDIIKSFQPDFIFLSEVKCSDSVKINLLASSLKYPNLEFVPSVGLFGGLLLLWNSNLHIQVLLSNDFVINFLFFSDPPSCAWQCSCVYGPVVPNLKGAFWDGLNSIGRAFDGPWLLIGDFNSILTGFEKRGGRHFAMASHGGLQQVVDTNGLIDLGFIGHPFTWSNKRVGAANIQERLDRALVNDRWKVLFLDATVLHLPAVQSDHCPILLRTTPYNHLFVLLNLSLCGRSMWKPNLSFKLLGVRGSHYLPNLKILRLLLRGGTGRCSGMCNPT